MGINNKLWYLNTVSVNVLEPIQIGEILRTLKDRMLLTSVSSSEVCGEGMSGLLLLRILDWSNMLPTVVAVARPMVL